MKPNSFGDTVSDEEVKTVNHMLHHSLAEEEAEKPGNRLCNPLAYTLAEMEPKKFGDTVADMEGMAYTIRQFESHPLGDV